MHGTLTAAALTNATTEQKVFGTTFFSPAHSGLNRETVTVVFSTRRLVSFLQRSSCLLVDLDVLDDAGDASDDARGAPRRAHEEGRTQSAAKNATSSCSPLAAARRSTGRPCA